VHPELPADEALPQLWEDVAFACRLDEDDPSAAWQERMRTLRAIAAKLTERRFDALEFDGPDTQLRVGLFPNSRWETAAMETLVVEGIGVRFEDGRAVQIDAERNVEVLKQRAAKDEGASRLGEVALVDREGRVGQLGTVFYDTLLDENASSHVAIGKAYDLTVGDEDRERANESEIHIDFMIGGDDVAVTGVTESGERVPVLREGRWQL
jgi:aminopeptidase